MPGVPSFLMLFRKQSLDANYKQHHRFVTVGLSPSMKEHLPSTSLMRFSSSEVFPMGILGNAQKNLEVPYRNSLRWQAGCFSPLHSRCTPASPRALAPSPSSSRVLLVLSTVARSPQQASVRLQPHNLQGRSTERA